MTHPYEKGLFGAAYVSVCLWAVYEWMQPVNGHAVAEETWGICSSSALFMVFSGLCWLIPFIWGTGWPGGLWEPICFFGLYFWYDASAAGIHRYLMLSGPEVFLTIFWPCIWRSEVRFSCVRTAAFLLCRGDACTCSAPLFLYRRVWRPPCSRHRLRRRSALRPAQRRHGWAGGGSCRKIIPFPIRIS